MPNADQIAYWNGPRGGQWVEGQELLDRQLARFGEAALKRAAVGAAQTVVDVGCGCGATTLELARAVGGAGSVRGVDVSRPMLARAAERLSNLPQVKLTCADAAGFSFDGTAHCVFSRFGVMFFDDPPAAFANLRRALRPKGRLVFVCWRGPEANAWMTEPLKALKGIIEVPPAAPDAPGPLALADPVRIRDILGRAGYTSVELESVDDRVLLGEGKGLDAATAEAMFYGPTARVLIDADAATRARAAAAIRAALARHAEGNDVRLSAGGWVVAATVRLSSVVSSGLGSGPGR